MYRSQTGKPGPLPRMECEITKTKRWRDCETAPCTERPASVGRPAGWGGERQD